MKMTRLPLFVVLLLFTASFITPTAAEIKSLTISDDSRPMILFEKFGFTQSGHVSVSVSSVSVVSSSSVPIPDPSRLGFFLMSEESLLQVVLEIEQKPNFCVLDSNYVLHLFTLKDLSSPPGSQIRALVPGDFSERILSLLRELRYGNQNFDEDIVCCCAILFPIVWSIRSLRETSKTDGKAARNLAKLTLFRQFYIVVIGYLYFTRIVVFALKTIAAYKYRWVSNAAEEIASLAFYMLMFYMFRPVEKNEYFVLDEEEEEAAELALKEDDFEL
ncbi:uncharacterized protein LOC9298233 [Arabidopsis lyrata subsp. lyrata]|uniref:uncharacterized protein LOC9298233 n=1 Tax=Arabidopsis lyrata subsp. lyrata TaxID=81972 RepID=UPI000A29BE53|nr:uncharacterized protein LOC9298233 [Arabidopsis lyrata subsp. lyrata]|eukprot:XP_020871398.1 uncharacterized protein LOC9298233 [Arabidopsis lyrata subsp. lyrata]